MNCEHEFRYIHNPDLMHMVLENNDRRLLFFFFFLNDKLICRRVIFHILDSAKKIWDIYYFYGTATITDKIEIQRQINEKMDYQMWEWGKLTREICEFSLARAKITEHKFQMATKESIFLSSLFWQWSRSFQI